MSHLIDRRHFLFQRKVGVIVRVEASEKDLPLYYLQNLDGSEVKGSLYRSEIKPLGPYDVRGRLTVSKVLDEKKEGNKTYALVQYEGLNPSFQHWVEKNKVLSDE